MRNIQFLSVGWSIWLLVLPLLLMAGCQTSPDKAYEKASPISGSADLDDNNQTLRMLYQQHQAWRGTPYRLGGESHAGIDCSGFVQRTYHDVFGIKLPRTTSQQLTVGQQINKTDLQAGDLVFFRYGRHVGIYLEDDKFLHASTRLGVTISDMNNIYWSRKYWRSIRVKSHNKR